MWWIKTSLILVASIFYFNCIDIFQWIKSFFNDVFQAIPLWCDATSCLCRAQCSMNPVEHSVTVSMFIYKQPNWKSVFAIWNAFKGTTVYAGNYGCQIGVYCTQNSHKNCRMPNLQCNKEVVSYEMVFCRASWELIKFPDCGFYCDWCWRGADLGRSFIMKVQCHQTLWAWVRSFSGLIRHRRWKSVIDSTEINELEMT